MTLGNVLTALAIAVTLTVHGLYLASKVGALETKVDILWQEFSEQSRGHKGVAYPLRNGFIGPSSPYYAP